MDYALCTHGRQVPNAHHRALFNFDMDMGTRLREAREKAGYDSASDAASAMGVPYATYAQHENGNRSYPAERAKRYARFFKTTPEWLLYGRGKSDPIEPSIADLQAMIADALSELTLETKIADLPRIVAPSLHEQIARYRADREDHNLSDPAKAPGTAALSQMPTKQS